MRGRKPKPTPLRVIEGNREHRALNYQEPQPERIAPPCPSILRGEARKRWRWYVKELEVVGLLAHCDQGTIAAAAQTWARWVAAERQLQIQTEDLRKTAETAGADPSTVDPMVVRTAKGNFIQNPYVGIANAAKAELVKIEAVLGLNFVERSRIHISQKSNKSRRDQLLA